MSKPDLYAVFGQPVAHSKSPTIHAHFAKQTQQNIEYIKIEAPLDAFAQSVGRFFNQDGGLGCNVTLPFKEQAWQLVDEKTPRAQWAGAANTIKKLENGKLLGDNTDGVGLVTDLIHNHHITLTGKRILVLGAGGAARGILQPILEQSPSAVVIANRTLSKAQLLAQHFNELGKIEATSFEQLINYAAFDIIINGTSASVSGDVPPVSDNCINNNTVAYDLFYANELTAFCKWAKQKGLTQVFDGLGMLIEQAAEAFYVWRGIKPDTAALINSMRSATS